MIPTSSEIFMGMKWSLENEIAPLLDNPRAQSSVRCMLMLLDHLILRVDSEGPVLDQDNRDILQTLEKIAEWLKQTRLSHTHPEIGNLITEIETTSSEQTSPKEHVPAISVLLEVNTSLKGLFLRVIKVVETHRETVPLEVSDQCKREIDKLLRQQLDRDYNWIEPAFAGKPHI